MSIALRVLLVIFALLASAYVLRRIHRSRISLADAGYWIFIAVLILLFSIFPKIVIYLSAAIGVASPANFVFLLMIALAIGKLFTLSIDLSEQKEKLRSIIQEYAIHGRDEHNHTGGAGEHGMGTDSCGNGTGGAKAGDCGGAGEYRKDAEDEVLHDNLCNDAQMHRKDE